MIYDLALELDAVGTEYTTRDNALRLKCPFHDDTTPSCDLFKDGMFKCHACGVSGSLARLIGQLTNRTQSIVQSELDARYGTSEPPLAIEQIEKWHQAIWLNNALSKKLLDALYSRGINDETIRRYRIGVDATTERITIPISDPSGQYVNVRKYLPGGNPKMTSLRGRGKRMRPFPFAQLRYKCIVLCGGEIKALATAQALNPFEIGAISLSRGGEQDWDSAIAQFFVNKRVVVCNDIDDVGLKASEFRCTRLQHIAELVKLLELPLDREKYPHGDINDYLSLHSPEELLELIKATPPFEAFKPFDENGISTQTPTVIQIAEMNSARYINQRVSCSCTVSALDQQNYAVPKTVEIQCNKDQDYCGACPVFLRANPQFMVSAEDSIILAMIESKKSTLREELYSAFGIPTQCKASAPSIINYYKVVDTRIQKELDLSDHQSDRLMVPALIVDDIVDLNETYEITGKLVPHPKTQAITVIVSKTEAMADALSTFDPGDLSEFEVFQPDEWTVESIQEKLKAIYNVYSHNVTRIYNRPNLHTFVDLVFHSVLSIPVEEQSTKGWLELLVIGDSSQGKSETLIRLCEYYGLGARVDCKNATTAGLLGGLEQISGKWFAQWGVIPTHDRRLVVLEELKGLRREVFTKLTDMRSSGIAEISKIQRRRAQARTRLVALTNPKGSQTMSTYAHGVRAVQDIVENPEDIRRFDAVIVLNKDDIDPETLNQRYDTVPEFFTRDVARRLVLWSWTRHQEHIRIPPETYTRALEVTRELCNLYSDEIPLIDRGSTKLKVLRFATALACRTFSVDDDNNVIVRPCHVDVVLSLLNAEYSSCSSGYLDYSVYKRKSIGEYNADQVLEEFRRAANYKVIAENMLANQALELQDFCDWGSWTRDEAALFLSALVRANALKRLDDSKAYTKLPAVMPLLRTIAKGEVILEPPSHIDRY